MSDHQGKVALVYDSGIFVPFAQALGGEAGFSEVLYFSPWVSYASKSQSVMVGKDMPGITRVDSFWDNLKIADVVVFTDVGHGDLQVYLQQQGKRVWGTRRADLLELDRIGFRQIMGGLGEPVPETDKIIGLEALKDYLQDPENDGKFLKGSFFRGDFETTRHIKWSLSEDWYNDLVSKMGPHGKSVEIIAESPIEGIEPGWDGYAVDGKYPTEPIYSYEIKNAAYAGTWTMMLPEMKHLAEAISEPLGSLGARGNFHFEARIAEDGTGYLTDPCARPGSPVIESMGILIENWAEIVWEGSGGNLVEPVYSHEWVAQVVLKSPWSLDHFLTVRVAPEYANRVFFNMACGTGENEYMILPSGQDDIVGNACGLGDTLEEAIAEALAAAEAVEGYQVDYDHNIREELTECFEEN